MSAKQLRKKLSKAIWASNNKVLQDLIERTLGKVQAEPTAPQVFVINPPDTNKQTVLDDNDVIEGEVEQYQLAKRNDDNKE